MNTPIPKPSDRFNHFIAAYGSVHAAATAWDVDYQTLYRFTKGKGGLTVATAMKIANALKVPMNNLFVNDQAYETTPVE